jgi:hypothetical protein
MLSYLPLSEGETMIGRDAPTSRPLALNEGDFEAISKNHLTIAIAADQSITVTDHSTNGTVLETVEPSAG